MLSLTKQDNDARLFRRIAKKCLETSAHRFVQGDGCERRSGRVKDQRAQFDAFARQHVRWSGRVFKGRVGGEPCLVRG